MWKKEDEEEKEKKTQEEAKRQKERKKDRETDNDNNDNIQTAGDEDVVTLIGDNFPLCPCYWPCLFIRTRGIALYASFLSLKFSKMETGKYFVFSDE